jgi:hypothetical protein
MKIVPGVITSEDEDMPAVDRRTALHGREIKQFIENLTAPERGCLGEDPVSMAN